MRVIARTGRNDIATVYLAETTGGKLIEFAESLQPPRPREEKWVLTISTLYGCPVGCRFCDAGGDYQGKISKDEIISQINYLVKNRFADGEIPVKKFKIQLARMGEPSLNPSVLDVLDCLPELYDAPGLIPSLSTVAPKGTDSFFLRLLEIRKKYGQRFQFQFSIHTTDEKSRDWLIPIKKWSFERMAEYGKAFRDKVDRKITLNFALAEGLSVDPNVLLQHFAPDQFLIKVTPVNTTFQASRNEISSIIPSQKGHEIVDALRSVGYTVILSIGELAENYIGSNCGQYVTGYQKKGDFIEGAYTYKLERL